MKIVIENSDADLAKHDAARSIELRLRELAANLLRVMRGAGKPAEIAWQAQLFINGMVEYQKVAGRDPPAAEIAHILRDWSENRSDGWSGEALGKRDARTSIIRGSLQIAASRLLSQVMLERQGEEEMRLGMRLTEDARAEAQQRRKAEESKIRAATRPKRAKRKKRT